MKTASALSVWLRLIGMAALVGAGVAFLVQGWSETSTLARELSWGALTLVLVVFGIVAARKLRDPAGARLALALAAATIVVHFAELGSAYWSYRYEGAGSFTALAGASLVLVPLAPALGLGMAALVRGRSAVLTLALFLLSAPLLLPTRDGDVIAALAAVQLALSLALELGLLRRDARLKTLEGGLARALLLVPVAILLLRNAYYEPTDAWLGAVVLMPSLIAFVLPRVARIDATAAGWLEVAGGFGIAAAVLIALPSTLGSWLLASAVLGAGAFSRQQRAMSFAVASVGLACLLSMVSLVTPDVSYALGVLPVGVLQTAAAMRRRSRTLLVLAPLAALLGLGGQVVAHVAWPAQGAWMIAAAGGVTLLVVASLIESRRAELSCFWTRLNRRVAGEP